MAYTPQTWIDDDTSKPLSAARLTVMENGIEDADTRLTPVEERISPVQAITYGATITPDASTGSVFYCIATGDIALAEPTNGTNGKFITIAIQASGANRVLTLPSGTLVGIPSGDWWSGTLLYLGTPAVWLLTDGI